MDPTTYAQSCGRPRDILLRVICHWLTRTVPVEILKSLACRLLVVVAERLVPGAMHHHLSTAVCPRGSLSHTLLGVYTPWKGMMSVTMYTVSLIAFRLFHALACQAITRNYPRTPILPTFLHILSYNDDNARYWFERTVSDWRIVTWGLPGRSPAVVGDALRALHGAMTWQHVLATELMAETASITAQHFLMSLHGVLFRVPTSLPHGTLWVMTLEVKLWCTALAIGGRWAARRVARSEPGTYPATFVYDRAHEIAYIAYHVGYVMWSLALRSPSVQRMPFIATRIIPQALREEEEFYAQAANLSSEQLVAARKALIDALEKNAHMTETSDMTIPSIFGRSAVVPKHKARMTLRLLEKFDLKSRRRQDAVSYCSHGKTLNAAEATVLGSTDQRCAICLSGFSEGEDVRTLSCGHEFHDADIRRWLEKNVDCPLCRRPVGLGFLGKIETVCHILLALPTILNVFRRRKGDSSAAPWIMRLI